MFTKQVNYLIFILALAFFSNVLLSNATPLPALLTRDGESITLYVRDVKPIDTSDVEMMFVKRGGGYYRGKIAQASQWAFGRAKGAVSAYNKSSTGQRINSSVRQAEQRFANTDVGKVVTPHAQTAVMHATNTAKLVGGAAKSYGPTVMMHATNTAKAAGGLARSTLNKVA